MRVICYALSYWSFVGRHRRRHVVTIRLAVTILNVITVSPSVNSSRDALAAAFAASAGGGVVVTASTAVAVAASAEEAGRRVPFNQNEARALLSNWIERCSPSLWLPFVESKRKRSTFDLDQDRYDERDLDRERDRDCDRDRDRDWDRD